MKRLPLHTQLLKDVARDLMRYRGLLFWTALAVVSAFVIVYQAYLYRELMAERETYFSERDALDVEWRHLIVEQNSLSEHSRIERLARQEMGLQRPNESQEVLVPWR
ncbi:MAG TPA: cell division protein FtsL [Aliidiomarina sp.]|nr:cell division protein FtsL [Aliidiomarina sp.]